MVAQTMTLFARSEFDLAFEGKRYRFAMAEYYYRRIDDCDICVLLFQIPMFPELFVVSDDIYAANTDEDLYAAMYYVLLRTDVKSALKHLINERDRSIDLTLQRYLKGQVYYDSERVIVIDHEIYDMLLTKITLLSLAK